MIRSDYFLKVLSLIAASRLLGALKDIWLASYFATSLEIEIYFLALVVPLFIANVVGGSLRSSFVPEFYRIKATNSESNLNDYAFNSLKFAASLAVILCLPCVALSQWFFPVMKGEGSLEALLLMSLIPFPLLISAALEGFLIAKKKSPALISISAIGPILTILVLFWGGASIQLLVYVTLAAAVIEMLMTGVLAGANGLRLGRSLKINFKILRQPLKQFGSLLGGSALQSGMEVLDKGMAAYLVMGSVAALHYGTKITVGITAIFAGAMSQVFLPAFSEAIAKKDFLKLRTYFLKLNILIILASVALAAILFWQAQELVSLIFRHGNFKDNDVLEVTRVHRFFVLQIPFYMMGLVAAWVLVALQSNLLLTFVAVISFFANGVGNYILMFRFGVAGISLSTSIVYFISWVILFSLVIYNLNQKARQVS